MGVGQAAQALLGSDNAPSAVERGDRVFVPVIFPEFSWFQDFIATVRNMPPLAFGMHNEQYDCDMVII